MSFYLCFLKGTLWSWSHGCTICEPFSLGYQAHVQLLQPFYQIQMNHLTNKPYFLVVIIPVSSGPNHLFSHFLSTFQYFVLYFQMVHLWGNPFFFLLVIVSKNYARIVYLVKISFIKCPFSSCTVNGVLIVFIKEDATYSDYSKKEKEIDHVKRGRRHIAK